MKRYIARYDEESIVDVALPDKVGAYFWLDAETDCEDLVHIDFQDDCYVLWSDNFGVIYQNKSLYEVLAHFTDKYSVNSKYVKEIFEVARNYIRR